MAHCREMISSRLLLPMIGMVLLMLGEAVVMSDIPSRPSTAAEAQALMAFKAGITSDPFSRLESWDAAANASAANPCSNGGTGSGLIAAAWKGIVCDAQNLHVVTVNLLGFNLSGSVSASLARLPALSTLDLSDNNFSGSLPSSLFVSHSALQNLDFSFNSLTGQLPESLGNLSALLTLDLSSNMFVGEIPASLGQCKQLETLILWETGLTGIIPPEIWQLPALSVLHIEDTSGGLLNGSLPESFAFCRNITELVLDGFNATGSPIPSSLGDCHQLEILLLAVIGLQGLIPPEIWQLPLLQVLVVEDIQAANAIDKSHARPFKLHGSLPAKFQFCPTITWLAIDGVNLTGEIPPSLGLCTTLEFLDLSHSSLQGVIPATFHNLTRLEILYFQSNFLTGGIPASLSQCSQLVELRLGDNPLSGSIPKELGELTQLQVLSLYRANLLGSVPWELGGLAQLQVLDLSNNMLIGPIPKALQNCTNLQTLRLFQNKLTGKIEQFDLSQMQQLKTFTVQQNSLLGGLPSGFTDCQNLELFDVGENNFSGALNSSASGLSKLRVLVMSYNKLIGEIPGWVWKLPMLQVLDISNNRFTGSMPATVTHLDYFKQNQRSTPNQSTLYEEVPITLKSTFQVLSYVLNTRDFFDVSMNRLEGEIAESFGELVGLTGLNLSHNLIQGQIPSSLGNLTNLEVLDLSHNSLSGGIPQQLGFLGSLSSVDVLYNHLQGPIPTTNNFDTRFDQSSFEDNPGLCGIPLPTLCSASGGGGAQAGNTKPDHDKAKLMAWITDFASPWGLLVGYPIGVVAGLYIYRRVLRRL